MMTNGGNYRSRSGVDVMIFKIFSPKKLQKMAFLTQNKAKICKILIITLVLANQLQNFGKHWQKSQKIVIITSTPGVGSSTYCKFGQTIGTV
jgi:vacuolar-type H+-ATPase subunit F/Vma7